MFLQRWTLSARLNKTMNRFFASILLIALTATRAFSADLKIKSLLELKPLDPKGEKLERRLEGKNTLLLQFWASWCVGCSENMETLNDMVTGQKKAILVPISIDEKEEMAKAYFRKKGPKFKQVSSWALWDADASLSESLDVTSVPFLLVVDSKGKVLQSIEGHLTGLKKEKVKNLLGR